MTQSMTGFARIQAESELGTVSIEIKSVNSRHLDVFFKVPESIKPLESSLRQVLAKQLSRGKIECAIRFQASQNEKLSINQDYVSGLLAVADTLSKDYRLEKVTVGELLRLPHVLVEQTPDHEALKNWLMPLFHQAITALVEQRHSEGKHLQQLIAERLDSITAIVADAEQSYHASTHKIREKLHDKLAEVAEKYQNQLDETRFEQEMIYLLQKMDIAEEIDRLNGHIIELRKLLQSNHPVGRKMDFLLQEMNRESNTIASKSQQMALTMNAVELKVLLEQIREQIQNIE